MDREHLRRTAPRTEFSAAVVARSPPPSATRPGARSTCSPTSTTRRRHRRRGGRALRAPPQRRPPPPRQARRRRLPRGRRRARRGRRRRPAVEALPGHRRAGRRSTCRCATTTSSSRCSAGRSRCCRRDAGRGAWPRRSAIEYGRAMAAAMGRRARRPPLVPHGARTRSPTRSPPTASPPTPRSRGNELRIVSEHCPFGDAAIEHPVICAVDRGHGQGDARRALRRHRARPRAVARPQGDDVCVTAFNV